ncbi:right-handed parallel beta-helix repeat-containing protein [Haladaptatus pallidirubidus]|uniref:right-handed parallel beta-helix repeat-containing protein n=1 Tax=Haladaptatus pallidirubidus TaxID=1008152 RepID=UPI0035E88753
MALPSRLVWQPLVVSILVGLVIGGSIVPSSALAPGPGEGAGSQQAKQILSCTTISEPGYYVVQSNITNRSEDSCIRIEASDVTLDANGRTISGVQNETLLEPFRNATNATTVNPTMPDWVNHGVVVGETTQVSNVTISNLIVTDWTYGVAFLNVTRGTVRDVTAERNGNGIAFFQSTESAVSGSTAANNTAGIVLQRVEDTSILKSVVENNSEEVVFTGWTPENNAAGIVVQNAQNVTVAESRAANNSAGVTLYRTTDSTVTENTLYQNTNDGIKLLDTTGVTVSENDVRNTTTYDGIQLRNSSENEVSRNIVRFNSLSGISATDGSENNTIGDNHLVQNGLNGILVFLNSTNNTVTENYAFENAHSGIALVDGADENELTGNVIENTTGGDPFSTQAGYTAGIVINQSSNNLIVDTVTRNNIGWAFYSVDNASQNAVRNFTIARTTRLNTTSPTGKNFTWVDLTETVSFVSRDVGVDINISESLTDPEYGESGLIEPDWEPARIGPYLRVTQTSEDGRIADLSQSGSCGQFRPRTRWHLRIPRQLTKPIPTYGIQSRIQT